MFKERMGGRGFMLWGKCDLATPVIKHLTNFDFIITLNWMIWKPADLVMRTAMLDHELEHCGITAGGKFEVRKHDIQEFNSMVGRWGAYHAMLARFVKLASPQLNLELMNGGKVKKTSDG